jgi:hypothetical protein
MENNNNNEKKETKEPKVKNKDGLNIAYDKGELKKFYPHLMDEISDQKKIVNIDSVKMEIEQEIEEDEVVQNNQIPTELINPGTIDFIRRCTNDNEAFEILDYLLNRNEITSEEYTTYKNQIQREGGLKKLIDKCGGPKKPGYYYEKYYKKKIKYTKNKNSK